MKKPKRERPVVVVWTEDGVFVPLPRFKRLCDEQFAVHEEIAIIRSENRNMSQHRAYFAQLKECFDNLAEEFNGRFPSPEHFRSWLLVQAGYCSETDYPMKDAKAVAQLGRDLRRLNPYAILKPMGDVLKHFEPESQSTRAMGKERFEASCRAVLEIATAMARTTPAEVRKNAGRAA